MIAPDAVDLDESAREALAAEAERLDERDRPAVRRQDLGARAMEAAIGERVVEHRRERVAHEALPRLAGAEPVADAAAEVRPVADRAQRTDPDDARVVARADEKPQPAPALAVGAQQSLEAPSRRALAAARGARHPRREVVARAREKREECGAVRFAREPEDGARTDPHDAVGRVARGGLRRDGRQRVHAESVVRPTMRAMQGQRSAPAAIAWVPVALLATFAAAEGNGVPVADGVRVVAQAASAAPRADGSSPRAAELAARAETPTLDDLAAEIRDRHALPGLVVAIVDRSGVRAIGAAGTRGADAGALACDDRMHLGSCTKAFTATLAAVLVADGTLRWNSTVGEVFARADEGARDAIDAGWRETTLEELLRHRGGAPAAPDRGDWMRAFACTDAPEACRAAFVAAMLARPPAQPRGTPVYSNQGYALAGRMIELAGGAPY